MKRMAFLLGGVALFAWGVAGALTACGGDDDAAVADNDAGSTSSTSSGSSSGGTTSSSGGTSTSSSGGTGDGGGDAGGGNDGGGDSGGGFSSNPNKITCGSAECTVGTQQCCTSFTDAGCIASGMNCQGLRAECDEKADCNALEVCCASFSTGGQCMKDCKGGSFQTCKTNTECASGTCKVWTCTGNVKIRACEAPFTGCQ